MSELAIETRALVKRFGRTRAVDGLELRVSECELAFAGNGYIWRVGLDGKAPEKLLPAIIRDADHVEFR